MASPDERVLREVADLLSLGERVLGRAESLRSAMAGAELSEATSWVTRVGNLLRRLYGERSEPFTAYATALSTPGFWTIHAEWNGHIARILGVVQTVKHDLDQGLLLDLRGLAQADVFADFLEMSEHLLDEGYKDAGAVIIGAVLEDNLRTLAAANGLAVTDEKGRSLTLGPLNDALSGKGVYTSLVHKQVGTWAHLRNKAAHGRYGEYTREEVRLMLQFVQSFATDHVPAGGGRP